jgi:hypothetical protein
MADPVKTHQMASEQRPAARAKVQFAEARLTEFHSAVSTAPPSLLMNALS